VAQQEAMLAGLAVATDPVVREVALPLSRAIAARAAGQPQAACNLMRPVLDRMAQLGGSHAQQDMLELLFLECATAAGSRADLRLALARASAKRGVPPQARVLWRAAASLD
jgi:hypothetical protein